MSLDQADKAALAIVLDRIWKRLIRFPRAEVCRHYAAIMVLEEMEKLGIEPPIEIIKAVVEANDEIALAWERGAD